MILIFMVEMQNYVIDWLIMTHYLLLKSYYAE